MFERFSDEGRKVIVLAREEAERYDHNYLGPEHLLLGILRAHEDVLHQVAGAQITLSDVRLKLEHHFTGGQASPVRSPGKVVFGEIHFTSDTKTTIEHAVMEARRLGSKGIYPRHLLMGVLSLEESLPLKVLTELGVRLEDARVRLQDYIAKASSGESFKFGLLNEEGLVVEEFSATEDDLNFPSSLLGKLSEAIRKRREKEAKPEKDS